MRFSVGKGKNLLRAKFILTDFLFFSVQTNDFVRDVFRDKDGFISLPFEIVAGGCVSIF